MSGENSNHTDDIIEAEEARGRGILTSADRAYLLGEKEYSTQGERDARYRIRDRTENALLDLNILNDHLQPDDRSLGFEEIPTPIFFSAFEFLFKGLFDTLEDAEDAVEAFEQIAAAGIGGGIESLKPEYIVDDVDVKVSIEKHKPELEELKDRYLQEEEDYSELTYLLRRDAVPGNPRLAFVRLLEHLYHEGAVPESELNLPAPEGEEPLNKDDFESIESYIEAVKEQIRVHDEGGGNTEE